MTRPVLLHLHPDERVILVLRRHWFVFAGHILTALVIGSIFTGIVFWANAYLNDLTWTQIVGSLSNISWIFVLVTLGLPLVVAARIIWDFIASQRSGDMERIQSQVNYLKRRWHVIIAGTFGGVVLINLVLAFLLLDVIAGHPLPSMAGQMVTEHYGRGVLMIATSMYALSLILYLFVAWMDYYLDVFIVTNRQIVNIQQLILVGQKITETNFQQIQNSYSKVSGIILSLLDIGTVFVETAGEKENFQFNYVRHPGYATKTILELQQQQWEYGNIVENMDDQPSAPGEVEEVKPFEYKDYLKPHPHHPGYHHPHPPVPATPQAPIIVSSAPATAAPVVEDGSHTNVMPFATVHVDAATAHHSDVLLPGGRLVVDEGVLWHGEGAMTADVEQLLNSMDSSQK